MLAGHKIFFAGRMPFIKKACWRAADLPIAGRSLPTPELDDTFYSSAPEPFSSGGTLFQSSTFLRNP